MRARYLLLHDDYLGGRSKSYLQGLGYCWSSSRCLRWLYVTIFSLNCDVEVQDIFAHSQFCIQLDCRLITKFRLNEDDISTSCLGYLLQFVNQGRPDALTAMW